MRFLLLGERAVVAAGGEAVPAALRTVELVAWLAAHIGVPQPRLQVAAAFWPDTGKAQAQTNLRRELHHLRRLLVDDGSLVVTATDLTWSRHGASSVDLVEVRDGIAEITLLLTQGVRGRAAHETEGEAAGLASSVLTAYRGDLLPGLDEPWVNQLRTQVEEEVLGLGELLARAVLGRGTGSALLGPALEAARRRVEARPLQESGHVRLMQLREHQGELSEALAAYHRCARILREELGADPAPATREVLARLLSAGPPDQDEGADRVRTAGLVGRAAELQILLAELDASREGVRVVLVHGEAGSGKSRLVQEVVGIARARGITGKVGRGYPMAGSLPLAPVVDWLEDTDLLPEALDPEGRHPDRRHPEGRDEGGDLPSSGHRDLGRAWGHLVFLRDLAERVASTAPAVLVLDDLQWVDDDTLELVTSLLRWFPRAPVLLILTARSADLVEGSSTSRWVRGLEARTPLRRVRTGPLSVEESTSLLRRSGHSHWARDRCLMLHATTGGYPLHLLEVARLADDVDEAGDLRAVLTYRFDDLSTHAREVADLVSVAGRPVGLPLLCEAGDLDDATTATALDELCGSGLVAEEDQRYDFTHDLLRDTTYELLPPARRALSHRRVAEALELLHADHLDDVAGHLAEQFSRAGMPARAVDHLRRAARTARRVFAVERTAELMEEAVRQLRRLPAGPARDADELACLHDLGAAVNAREGWASPRLRSTLDRALVLAEGLRDDASLADVLTSLWATDFVRGVNHEALRSAQAALASATRTGDPVRVAVGRLAVGATLLHLGQPVPAREQLDQVTGVDLSEIRLASGSRPDVHARAWCAHVYALLGDPAEAGRLATAAVDLAGPHPFDLAQALAYAAVTAQLTDDRAALAARLDRLSGVCERYGIVYYVSWGEALQGWSVGGADGVRAIRTAIATLREAGVGARMTYWLSLLADVLDDPAEARAVLDAAAAHARGMQDLWWLPEIERQRALLRPAGQRRPALERALGQALEQGNALLADRCRRSLQETGDASGVGDA